MNRDFRVGENNYTDVTISGAAAAEMYGLSPEPAKLMEAAPSPRELARVVDAADKTRADLAARRERVAKLRDEHAALMARLTSESPEAAIEKARTLEYRIAKAAAELEVAVNASHATLGAEQRGLAFGKHAQHVAAIDGPESELAKATADLDAMIARHNVERAEKVRAVVHAVARRNDLLPNANATAKLIGAPEFTATYLPAVLQAISEKHTDAQWQVTGRRSNVSVAQHAWNKAWVIWEGSTPIPQDELLAKVNR